MPFVLILRLPISPVFFANRCYVIIVFVHLKCWWYLFVFCIHYPYIQRPTLWRAREYGLERNKLKWTFSLLLKTKQKTLEIVFIPAPFQRMHTRPPHFPCGTCISLAPIQPSSPFTNADVILGILLLTALRAPMAPLVIFFFLLGYFFFVSCTRNVGWTNAPWGTTSASKLRRLTYGAHLGKASLV